MSKELDEFTGTHDEWIASVVRGYREDVVKALADEGFVVVVGGFLEEMGAELSHLRKTVEQIRELLSADNNKGVA